MLIVSQPPSAAIGLVRVLALRRPRPGASMRYTRSRPRDVVVEASVARLAGVCAFDFPPTDDGGVTCTPLDPRARHLGRKAAYCSRRTRRLLPSPCSFQSR